MKVKAAGNSHVGRRRRLNEDSYLIAPELGLYLVADGMGGHKAGEVASRMVVETMTDYWEKMRAKKAPAFLDATREDISEEANHLVNSITMTNAMIHEAQKKPEYHKMGSTVSALLTEKDWLWSANVGDSPIYLFESGRLIQISEEHSVEAERKNMGLFGDSFSSTNPLLKNVLTRVLGLSEEVEVYITGLKPEPGDVVMACSDGLTNYMSENAIKTVLDDFSLSLERKVDILIEEANRGGGGDNITVILLEVEEEGRWQKFKKKFI